MPAPKQSRPRRKEIFAEEFRKHGKAVLFSESAGGRSSIAPNIRALSWSPTGSLIATSVSTNIRVWNSDKPNVRQSTELRGAGGVGIIEKVDFCPTHEAVLASTGADGFCRLWDVRVPSGTAVVGKGIKLAEVKTGDVGLFLTWHPSGSQLLVGRKDDNVQLVDIRRMTESGGDLAWDVSTQDSTPTRDMGQFNAMSFSNSGRQLFVTTGGGPVKILDWPSLTVRHNLEGHSSATNAVRQSPAGTFVAAGGNDGIVTLWDTLDWNCVHAVTTHTTSVRDLSFSFDGAYLVATGGMDARDSTSADIHITHVESGENVLTVSTQNPPTWAAWHPLRYWLAYSGDPGGLKILGAGTTLL